MFSKIRNDTFRTLATDKEFLDKVGEEKLVRCLEALVWRQLGAPSSCLAICASFKELMATLKGSTDAAEQGRPSPVDTSVPYVQGCNVLAAPFLYVLPSQLEAWACFTTFIEKQAPRYVRPTLVGVHDGLQASHFLLLPRQLRT